MRVSFTPTIRHLLGLLVALVVTVTGTRASAFVPCVGDCAGDGRVTVDELLQGVNIALGDLPLANCPRFDATGDGEVTIDELLAGVNNALDDCRPPGLLVSGAQFIPSSIEAIGTPASQVMLAGSDLVFNDGTEEPIKALSLVSRRLRTLVRQMGVPEDVEVSDGVAYWLDARSGFAASGCVGPGVIRVLTRTTPGRPPRTETLARSDNCSDIPPSLLVTQGFVYWVASLASPPTYMILRVPTGGGSAEEIVRSGEPIVALATSATHLYWLEGFLAPGPTGVLKRMPLAGGEASVVYAGVGSSGSIAGILLLDGDAAIVADYVFGEGYRLLRIPISEAPPVALTALPERPAAAVIHGAVVYLLDSTALRRFPLAGGVLTTVVDDVVSGVDLAATSGGLAWTESVCCMHGQKGRVRTLDRSGGQVTTLAQDVDAPGAVTAAGGVVYWGEGGKIGLLEGTGRLATVSLNGGPIAVLAQGVAQPLPLIATDGGRVYFADRFRIKSVALDGSVPDTLATGDFYVTGVAGDGARAYWTEDPFGLVQSVQLNSGVVQTLAGGSGPAALLRVSGGHLYWTESFDRILRVSASGGAVETLAGDLDFLSDLAVDASGVYFTGQDSGGVRRVPLGGGAITEVGMGLPLSWNMLALDSEHVYWMEPSAVWYAPKGGGGQVRVVGALDSDPVYANGIVSDGAYIFWSEVAAGTIRYAPVP